MSALSNEGNLVHTWWLLEIQGSFITQNSSVEISYFYSSSEISNILQGVDSIYHSDGYFDDPFLGDIAQSTAIALRIYDLLNRQISELLVIHGYWEEMIFSILDPNPEELYWMLVKSIHHIRNIFHIQNICD